MIMIIMFVSNLDRNALESISAQHQVEILQTRDTAAKDAASDTQGQVEEIAQRLLDLQNQLEDKDIVSYHSLTRLILYCVSSHIC